MVLLSMLSPDSNLVFSRARGFEPRSDLAKIKALKTMKIMILTILTYLSCPLVFSDGTILLPSLMALP